MNRIETAKRMISLWSRIDELLLDNEYYDDEQGCDICECTEDQVYDWIVEDKDFRLLSSEVIKAEIRRFMTDYDYRHNILLAFKLF